MISPKSLAKKMLPEPLVRRTRAWVHGSKIRRRPKMQAYAGTRRSVLGCCIAYNEYGGFCVPLSSAHRPAAQAILGGRVWEPETISFLKSLPADGDVIHAGTYFGDFLPALGLSRKAGYKVWAFEPNPENFQCAAITARINALENVAIENAGLGSAPGAIPMMISDLNGIPLGGGSRLVPGELREGFHRVEVVTVDGAVPADRKISAIHLDVEGFEQEALTGALATVRRSRPVLVLETLPERAWLDEFVFSIGYRETGKINANMILSV